MKTIMIGGTYNWRMRMSVPEDKIDELKEKFGEGTYHDGDIHNWSEMDKPDDRNSIDYFLKEIGGSMYSQNYGWDVEIDEFDVEEDE